MMHFYGVIKQILVLSPFWPNVWLLPFGFMGQSRSAQLSRAEDELYPVDHQWSARLARFHWTSKVAELTPLQHFTVFFQESMSEYIKQDRVVTNSRKKDKASLA